MLIVVLSRAVLGRRATSAEAWAAVKPRLPGLLGLTLLTGLALGACVLVGFLPLVLGALVGRSGRARSPRSAWCSSPSRSAWPSGSAISWSMVAPAYVLEGIPAMAAFAPVDAPGPRRSGGGCSASCCSAWSSPGAISVVVALPFSLVGGLLAGVTAPADRSAGRARSRPRHQLHRRDRRLDDHLRRSAPGSPGCCTSTSGSAARPSTSSSRGRPPSRPRPGERARRRRSGRPSASWPTPPTPRTTRGWSARACAGCSTSSASLVDAPPRSRPAGYAGLAVLVVLLVLAVVAVRLRLGRIGRVAAGADAALFDARPRSADEHRRAADGHAAARRVGRGGARAVPGRRARAGGAGAARPATRPDRRRGGGRGRPRAARPRRRSCAPRPALFDDVWYGGRAATAAMDAQLRAVDEAVRRARPAGAGGR